MIVFLDQSGQPGGAEICLADIAAEYRPDCRVILFSDGLFVNMLAEKKVPTTVLPLPKSLGSATKTASAIALAAKIPSLFFYTLKLRAQIAQADVLYFNTAKALMLGINSNWGRRTPTVFHLHDILSAEHFSATNLSLLVRAANRTQAVIANSEATAAQFRAAGGSSPLHVIPNGFHPADFDGVSSAEIDALQTQFNPAGKTVVAIFGRIARWKGQDLVLEAIKNQPDTCLWIVGDALFTGDDHDFLAELKELAKPLGARCQFLGFRHDIAALMHASDLVVHASRAAEPFGRVIVEAMLCRKPVIATNAGGPAEIVVDGETGLLVSPGDPVTIAEAIASLVNSPHTRSEMGIAARLRAEKLYALPTVLAATRSVIDSVTK